MNFLEAVEQMKQGKKVRVLQHIHVLPWIYKDRQFQVVEGKIIFPGKFDLLHFEGEWEIFEEPKKTLWDKQYPFNSGFEDLKLFSSMDVKEALKEFMKYFDMSRDELIEIVASSKSVDGDEFIRKKAKEIFGEELLE